MCRHHAQGGAGATDLAHAVEEACKQQKNFQFLYDAELSLKVRPCVLRGSLCMVCNELWAGA